MDGVVVAISRIVWDPLGLVVGGMDDGLTTSFKLPQIALWTSEVMDMINIRQDDFWTCMILTCIIVKRSMSRYRDWKICAWSHSSCKVRVSWRQGKRTYHFMMVIALSRRHDILTRL